MARRNFTDEELEQHANKEWNKVTIYSSDEKAAIRAKNLTGPKTPEGKKRALQNLQVGSNSMDNKGNLRHGGFVRRILNEEEQEWYFSRREDYLKDYDINGSADEATLHTVLMEEVIQYRLWKKQSINPTLDIDRPLSESTRRMRTALEDLGALRKQRLKQDEKTSALSIATIAHQFARELNSGNMQALLESQKEEEEAFLRQKKEREASKEIDADYEEVDEDVYGDDEEVVDE